MLSRWAILGVTLMLFAMLGSAFCSHTYHLGKCPDVKPMPDFDMSKFLGKWYVIQKTSTSSQCMVYNFTNTGRSGHYEVDQISKNPILEFVKIGSFYHCRGTLKIPNPDVPARMTVRFPISIGSASYVVFSTDYNRYAGLFTCQKLAFAHRLSATILSRTKTLDNIYIDRVRNELRSFGVSPDDLDHIHQLTCPHNDDEDINDAENPAGNPVTVPTDLPVDTFVGAPVNRPVNTPAGTPVETPVDTPVDTPVETFNETPVGSPVDTSVDAPIDTSVDTDVEKREPLSTPEGNDVEVDPRGLRR